MESTTGLLKSRAKHLTSAISEKPCGNDSQSVTSVVRGMGIVEKVDVVISHRTFRSHSHE